MHTNLEVKPVDVVILIVLAIMLVLAIKIIIGFFKDKQTVNNKEMRGGESYYGDGSDGTKEKDTGITELSAYKNAERYGDTTS